MKSEIQLITSEQTHQIRHQVLRPHQALSAMAYPGDDDDSTRHLAAFVDHNIIGIASIYQENHPFWPALGHCFRLRGMAVIETYRGQGVGQALLSKACELSQTLHADLLWCNARTPACGFYEAAGFTKQGEEFMIEGIGPHYVMFIPR